MVCNSMKVAIYSESFCLLPHGEHFIDPAVLTMEYDLLLQIPRIDWKWSSFIKNRTKMDAI